MERIKYCATNGVVLSTPPGSTPVSPYTTGITINVTDTNVKELTVTKESLRDIFPLLEVSPFVAEPILTSNLSGNSSAIKPTSSFVIGPNA